jgi:hypothetical protein
MMKIGCGVLDICESVWLGLVLIFVLFALVGGLSHLRPGQNTSIQRGLTMIWSLIRIVSGWWANLVGGIFAEMVGRRAGGGWQVGIFCWILFTILAFGVTTIGGMVGVGFMIKEFGICTVLD